MNILFIFLGGSIILFIAYKTYGTFISKKVYELDDSHTMPSVELEDGLDYVPTDAKFLAGQHFSAIAAAGPVTGPILAGAAFGWVPTLLWILGGTIFIGGVHDMGALVASIRNKGRSITETVRVHVSKRAWIGFNIFIYVALIFIIVAFTDITASAFVNQIEIGEGVFVGGGAIATSSLIYLALPIIMGILLRYTKLSLLWATIIFLPLVGVAIWVGQFIPLNIPAIGNFTPAQIWDILILLYCLIAAVVPVWALLQPRGHLGGYFMYASILVAFIGILFGGFEATFPAFKGMGTAANPLFPMLFITVACGACSGFHSLIGSGTTSKQLKKESDAKPIGYGMMLLESVVAIIALSTVMILAGDSELLKKSPNFIYASGLGSFMELLGVSKSFGIAFGLMAFTTFVYDTLDICTRLGRFIIVELTGWKGKWGRLFAAAVTAIIPGVLFLVKLTGPDGKPVAAWSIFWKTFGSSNQLLAGLALIGITVWLMNTAKNKKAWLYTLIPAIFMFVMSSWALIVMFRNYTIVDGVFTWPNNPNMIIPITCIIYLGLAIWMAIESGIVIAKKVKGTAALPETAE